MKEKIAILSPATEVKPHWIDGAINELQWRGYEPLLMPYAKGPSHGTFASSDAERLEDLVSALRDPEVGAILCARGGYGCNHLLSPALQRLVSENPKWLIGFSDISALHALWVKAGVPSLHCSMAKQLTLYRIEDQPSDIRTAAASETPDSQGLEAVRVCTDTMFSILEQGTAGGDEMKYGINYEVETPEGAIPGEAEGKIIGGNLAVLNGLAATPWDILSAEYVKGKILFLEDVGEKIYQVERMLTRLHLAGVFEAAAGVIFGKFTDYKSDRNFTTMEEMISYRLKEWGVKIPVALNFPVGHISDNRPIPEGAYARLHISLGYTTLSF